MATSISDLDKKVTELQAAVDAEQLQIKAALDELKAIIADGGTEAQRQAIADKLEAPIVDVKGTIA